VYEPKGICAFSMVQDKKADWVDLVIAMFLPVAPQEKNDD
jgi:hypothetical protein